MKINLLQRQSFFYLIAAIILFLSFMVLKPFFSAIILAFLTAVFFKPVYDWFHRHFIKKEKVAALMTVIIVFFVVLIPIVLVGALTVNQIIQLSEDFTGSGGIINIENFVTRFNDLASIMPGDFNSLTVAEAKTHINNGAEAVGNYFLEKLPDIGSGAFNTFTWVIMYIILLYSFFPLYKKLFKFFEKLSPLDDRIDTVYFTRVIAMSKSMIKGTFAISVVQGVVSGIFLAIAGVPYVLFLTLIMILLGVIPMVGFGFVMVPIIIILLLTGSVWQGIMLLVVSVVIIGNIDNFLRPKLVSKKAELHPALIILGVIGGLQVFGVLGFIYGPVIMILLVTTIEMYLKYFQSNSVSVK